ncbi:hypothetical protein HETIRDRAFT_325582 [Heterobasidion irregulare TC 32-1]|uniref:Uncharacterized protein n=1 Tax=Heterobasidion irregulare (strain TC 32-1) TaxID=747525 RepID=W4JYT8_HETIT|nr:uncharacterized protein HETIRDRAFT_325582 [Heterobasidion irregulare TC 32-1]ETW78255.1 hypothetical protein HETIRDRAFT_325582 [Heterobasidion irregulare TC 32-1]
MNCACEPEVRKWQRSAIEIIYGHRPRETGARVLRSDMRGKIDEMARKREFGQVLCAQTLALEKQIYIWTFVFFSLRLSLPTMHKSECLFVVQVNIDCHCLPHTSLSVCLLYRPCTVILSRVHMHRLRYRRLSCSQSDPKVGVLISDEDYCSTILSLLPHHLAAFATSQLSAVQLIDPSFSIPPNSLMRSISEEDHHQRYESTAAKAARQTKSLVPKGTEEALAVQPFKGKDKKAIGGGPVFWNYGECSHICSHCTKPLKKPFGNADKAAGLSNAVQDFDEEDGGWVV